jgi:hypothetical protein
MNNSNNLIETTNLLINAYIEIAIIKGEVDEYKYWNDSQYQDNTVELTRNYINNLLNQIKQNDKKTIV